jgi:3-methyladenine DNA glycosylase AlkD
MPTVFRETGYRFFFVMADLSEPLHIHVMREKSIAKFWFDPIQLASNKGFRDHELREIADLIQTHADLIWRRWDERLRSRY